MYQDTSFMLMASLVVFVLSGILVGVLVGIRVIRKKRHKRDFKDEDYWLMDLVNHLDHSVVWEANVDPFQFTFISDRLHFLIGIPAADMLEDSQLFFKHVPTPFQRMIYQMFDKAVQTQLDQRIEHQMVTRDGKMIWVQTGVHLRARKDGTRRFFGIIVDVTPFKKSERELKEFKSKAKLALEAARVGIWEIEVESGKIKWTDVQADIVGFDSSSSIVLNDYLTRIHPQDREDFQNAIHEAARNVGSKYSVEYRILTPDGNVRWMHDQGECALSHETSKAKILAVSMDTTERKENELNTQQVSRAKSEFLTSMSHEIRTPMNAILGFSSLLREGEIDEKTKNEYLERISKNGEHLLKIIDDILNLSRYEAGEVPVERVKFALIDEIQEVIASVKGLADLKNLRVGLVILNPVPQVIKSDPMRMKQILTNLLGNAVKFTEEGEICVRLKHITEGTHGFIEIEVADTGMGLSDEQMKKIFKPFEQAESSTSRQFGGTGLGLVISKRLAEALGGELNLKSSTVGKGSVFYLRLPTGDLENVAFTTERGRRFIKNRYLIEAKESSSSLRLEGLRVLLAEDSADSEFLIHRYLSTEGADVTVVRNGSEALEEISKKNEFHVILMDIQMPVMDGLEATRQIRGIGFDRPIIALSAHAMREEVEDSFRAGCDAHLPKPVTRSQLVKEILSLVEKIE